MGDAQVAAPVEVLLPALQAGSGAFWVVQGVPGQAEQEVHVAQDHLGLDLAGVVCVGPQSSGDGEQQLRRPDVAVGPEGHGWRRQRPPKDQRRL